MYSCSAIRRSRLLPHLLYRNTRPAGNILSSHWCHHRQNGKSNAQIHSTITIGGHSNQITENVSKRHSSTLNMRGNEAPLRIHAWLSPLEPDGSYGDASRGRSSGGLNWVLNRNGFKQWCESPNGSVDPSIFYSRDKGTGKTYLSSLIIDAICEQACRDGVVVLFFYSNHRAQKDQSAVNIIGCLLRQFILGTGEIPEGIRSAFEESGQGYRKGLQLLDMVKLFIKTIIPVERAYICIDSMDEILPEERSKFLDALGQISQEVPNTRLFFTAMPHIRPEIQKHFKDGPESKSIKLDPLDIGRHISWKLYDNERDAEVLTEDPMNDIIGGKSEKTSEISPPIPPKMDDVLGKTSKKPLERSPHIMPKTDDIFGGTSEKASEIPPLIALKTDDILGGTSKTALERPLPIAGRFDGISHESRLAMQKEMLRKITMTGMNLDSLYGQTLQQIKEQKGDLPRLGMEVLMWVSHAKRPLRMDELCQALAVGSEATHSDPKNIPSRDTVLGSCLGLVMAEKRTLKVRLIHDTLQQYLSRPGILSGAHKVLGETCIAYLNSPQVKRICASKVEDLEHMPFLEYSSSYWGTHAKIELSDRAKTLALELLEDFENHISFTLFFKKTLPGCYFPGPGYRFTGLHFASYMGIDPLVAILIVMKSCDINQEDPTRTTPLMWAVEHGNHGAARLLLTCDGVDPDKPIITGATPLWWATNLGDEKMVRVLVQGGADPNKPGNYGKTPLMIASSRRYKRIVALLQPPPITISDLD